MNVKSLSTRRRWLLTLSIVSMLTIASTYVSSLTPVVHACMGHGGGC